MEWQDSSIGGPIFTVTQLEQVERVGEAQHPGQLDHQATGDVAWMQLRMRALIARERQHGAGWHGQSATNAGSSTRARA